MELPKSALNIRHALKVNDIMASDLARKTGITPQSISKYVNGTAVPKYSRAALMGAVLGVSPEFLMGVEEPKRKVPELDDSVNVPVLGRVAAGIPIFAEENVTGHVRAAADQARGAELFALIVRGDSMHPLIRDGDTVIVRAQDDAEPGAVVVALVNGSDAVVKKYVRYESGAVALVSVNPEYPPLVFAAAEIDSVPVRIIGRVIETRSKL